MAPVPAEGLSMRRLLPLLLALFAAAPAAAQPPRVQSAEEALAQDAAEYARNIGTSEEEAERRLRAQAESVAATEEIRRVYAARLAGISIEHRPDLRIRVLLTGDAPVPGRTIRAGGMDLPIDFVTGAVATGDQIRSAMVRKRDGIDDILPHNGIGYDARTGEMVVMADVEDLGGEEPAAVAARIAEVAGVPVRIRILNAPQQDFGVAGGGRVEGQDPGQPQRLFCTTGFVVTDGARSGIVTAAHCPDSLTYYDPAGEQVPLQFVGGWGARFQDVQVHVGGAEKPPLFRAGAADARPQIGQRLRARTRAGETVCHRGESSGYSCAEVELTDYAPPGELCGGKCLPTWVTVAGPGCRNGDSGGPVFAGTTAFGILKGGNYAADGRCNFYYYMSTDYLPPGWSLLVAGVQAAAPPPRP
jgi:streptogrisin C